MPTSPDLRGLLPPHLVDIADLSDEAIDLLLSSAIAEQRPESVSPGRIAGAAFFQPSTRTLFSFQSAALRIGLPMLTLTEHTETRLRDFYAESPDDALLYMQTYCDVLVIRHFNPLDRELLGQLDIPVINAGDGYNSHPTQALGDVATLLEAIGGGLNTATIGILGNIHLRTTRSFIQLIQRISSADIAYINPTTEHLDHGFSDVYEVESKEQLLAQCNVIYVSGFDHADFSSPYTPPRNSAQEPLLTNRDTAATTHDFLILHPGPKTYDLEKSLDTAANNKIWRQAKLATQVRRLILGAYAVQ